MNLTSLCGLLLLALVSYVFFIYCRYINLKSVFDDFNDKFIYRDLEIRKEFRLLSQEILRLNKELSKLKQGSNDVEN